MKLNAHKYVAIKVNCAFKIRLNSFFRKEKKKKQKNLLVSFSEYLYRTINKTFP